MFDVGHARGPRAQQQAGSDVHEFCRSTSQEHRNQGSTGCGWRRPLFIYTGSSLQHFLDRRFSSWLLLLVACLLEHFHP